MHNLQKCKRIWDFVSGWNEVWREWCLHFAGKNFTGPRDLIKTFPSWIFSSQKSRLCPDLHFLKAPVSLFEGSRLVSLHPFNFDFVRWEIERLLALLQTFDPFNLELRRPSFRFEQTLSRIRDHKVSKANRKFEIHLLVFSSWNWIDHLIRSSKPRMHQGPRWTKRDGTFELFNLEPCYLFKRNLSMMHTKSLRYAFKLNYRIIWESL